VFTFFIENGTICIINMFKLGGIIMRKILSLLMALLLLTTTGTSTIFATATADEEITSMVTKTFDKGVMEDVSSAYQGTEVEKKIIDGLENYDISIDISEYEIPKTEFSKLIFEVFYNHPELFYVSTTNVRYSMDATGAVNVYYPTYTVEKSDCPARIAEFNSNVNEILKSANNVNGDINKALVMLSKLTAICSYDLTAENCYTAYGCIVDRKAVCQGYAMAYNYLMKQLGIDSTFVTGTSKGQNHGWNIIKIGGKYYHVDVTWSDPMYNTLSSVSYDYFLLSDSEISSNHVIDSAEHTCPEAYTGDKFWQQINSTIATENGFMYYFSADKKLCKRNSATGEVSYIPYTSDTWMVWENSSYSWGDNYYSPIVKDNTLFYNTSNKIYKIDLNTMLSSVVYTLPSSEDGYIYGIDLFGSTVSVEVRQSPNMDDTAHTLTMDISNFMPQVPTQPTTQPTYVIGDVDGDNRLTISDVVKVQRHLARILLLDDDKRVVADVNYDGAVNSKDVVLMQQCLAKLIKL